METPITEQIALCAELLKLKRLELLETNQHENPTVYRQVHESVRILNDVCSSLNALRFQEEAQKSETRINTLTSTPEKDKGKKFIVKLFSNIVANCPSLKETGHKRVDRDNHEELLNAIHDGNPYPGYEFAYVDMPAVDSFLYVFKRID